MGRRRVRIGIIWLVAVGCGRLAFDPRADAGEDAAPDATPLPLVAHYPLDDTFGTTARDVIAGRDARCDLPSSGCPSSVAGPRGGGAAAFDGGACLRIPYDLAFDLDDGYTIAVWVRVATLPQAGPSSFVGRSYGSAGNSYGIQVAASGEIGFPSAPFSLLKSVRMLSVGIWTHVAVSWDGGTKAIYLGGTLDASEARTSNPFVVDAPITIGCDLEFDVETAYLTGELADLRFFDRALTAAEIQQLAL